MIRIDHLQKVPINGRILGLAVDPRGERVAIAQYREDPWPVKSPLRIWDTTSGELIAAAQMDHETRLCCGTIFTLKGELWSWGHRTIDDPHSHGLVRWNTSAQRPSWHWVDNITSQIWNIALSADESTLLLQGEEVVVVDVETLTVLGRVPRHPELAHENLVACFAPSNDTIWVYGTSVGIVSEHQLDGTPTGRIHQGPSLSGEAVRLAPDGSAMAIVGKKGTYLLRLPNGERVENRFFRSTSMSNHGGFSLDSSSYVFASTRMTTYDFKKEERYLGARIGMGRTEYAASAKNADTYAFVMEDGYLIWGSAEQIENSE